MAVSAEAVSYNGRIQPRKPRWRAAEQAVPVTEPPIFEFAPPSTRDRNPVAPSIQVETALGRGSSEGRSGDDIARVEQDLDHPELGACPGQVLPLVRNRVVRVTFEVVGEEAGRVLERHERAGDGQ